MPFRTAAQAAAPTGLSFQPIPSALPLATEGLSAAQQMERCSTFDVQDDMVLPAGFTYDVIAAWGDPVGDSRFGFNNDYVSFVPTGPNAGYLTINFEYISAKPWVQGFAKNIGKSLPYDTVMAAVTAAGDAGIDVSQLPEGSPQRVAIETLAREALIDVGLGVIQVRREADGRWVRQPSAVDRRVSGITGMNDGNALKVTGPAAAVFRKRDIQGYADGYGDRIVGTTNNCAGGTSPWGTVFSAEENFQDLFPEAVYPDGSAFPPSTKPFKINDAEGEGYGSVFGLAGNKYGWMVEIDPANPSDYGTKHSWLGRFRHEAVAIRAEANRKLAVYSGCDRRGGHVYKFISQGTVRNPQDKANSRLLETGMLYAAKFNPDGTGRWIPLQASTPVNPDLPSIHVGGMIPLPQRPEGGADKVSDDGAIATFKSQYATLGDLYKGNTPEEIQGAILIDAHLAANAAGATCTARPEDTDLAADGSLFIAFTSGSPSSSDGSPDQRVFKGPAGVGAYEYGWIVRLQEDGNDPAAMTFRWRNFSTGGEPAAGGDGFANPDNLMFDNHGHLWMVTDMSSDKLNQAVPMGRKDAEGEPISQSSLRAIYGNNSIWFIPTSGANAGTPYLFAYGPMDVEVTGPYLTPDQQTLFAAVQHPGEVNGTRQGMETQTIEVCLTTTDGQEFMQRRSVPVGSNWPSKQANDPPRPAVIAIRRQDARSLVES